MSASYTPELSAYKVRVALDLRSALWAGTGADCARWGAQIGRVEAVDRAAQQLTLLLSPSSRVVPAGGWDGQQPRRFELADPDAPGASAGSDNGDGDGGAEDLPPPVPPMHPEIVTYDLRSLIDPRLHAT